MSNWYPRAEGEYPREDKHSDTIEEGVVAGL